jgi:hypothetical protein
MAGLARPWLFRARSASVPNEATVMAANDGCDMFMLADFKVGQRAELHPATGLWMAAPGVGPQWTAGIPTAAEVVAHVRKHAAALARRVNPGRAWAAGEYEAKTAEVGEARARKLALDLAERAGRSWPARSGSRGRRVPDVGDGSRHAVAADPRGDQDAAEHRHRVAAAAP